MPLQLRTTRDTPFTRPDYQELVAAITNTYAFGEIISRQTGTDRWRTVKNRAINPVAHYAVPFYDDYAQFTAEVSDTNPAHYQVYYVLEPEFDTAPGSKWLGGQAAMGLNPVANLLTIGLTVQPLLVHNKHRSNLFSPRNQDWFEQNLVLSQPLTGEHAVALFLLRDTQSNNYKSQPLNTFILMSEFWNRHYTHFFHVITNDSVFIAPTTLQNLLADQTIITELRPLIAKLHHAVSTGLGDDYWDAHTRKAQFDLYFKTLPEHVPYLHARLADLSDNAELVVSWVYLVLSIAFVASLPDTQRVVIQ